MLTVKTVIKKHINKNKYVTKSDETPKIETLYFYRFQASG